MASVPVSEVLEVAGCYQAPVEPVKTLRDEFAMAALTGFCADPSNHELFAGMSDVARASYEMADAMMAARLNGGGE